MVCQLKNVIDVNIFDVDLEERFKDLCFNIMNVHTSRSPVRSEILASKESSYLLITPGNLQFHSAFYRPTMCTWQSGNMNAVSETLLHASLLTFSSPNVFTVQTIILS